MLEVLYGCGLRVSELTGLDVRDVDAEHGFVRVFGKGSKERLVPVAGAAEEALREYFAHGRPYLKAKKASTRQDPAALFLNVRGGRLTRQAVFGMVRAYGERVGLALAPTHAAPLVRDAHAPRRGRSAGTSGDARTRGHLDDADLHSRRPDARPRGVPHHASARAHALSAARGMIARNPARIPW